MYLLVSHTNIMLATSVIETNIQSSCHECKTATDSQELALLIVSFCSVEDQLPFCTKHVYHQVNDCPQMHASTNLRKHVHRYPKCMAFIYINSHRGLKLHLSFSLSLSLFLFILSLNNCKHLIICIIAKAVYLLNSLYGCMVLHCVMHVKADDIYGFVFVEIHNPSFYFLLRFPLMLRFHFSSRPQRL